MADAQDSRRTTTGRRGWEPSTCQPVGQQTPVSFSACCAAAIQTASCQTGDSTACKHVTKKELCKRCFSKYRAVEGTEQIILSCMLSLFFNTKDKCSYYTYIKDHYFNCFSGYAQAIVLHAATCESRAASPTKLSRQRHGHVAAPSFSA